MLLLRHAHADNRFQEKVCPNDKERLVKLLSASPPSRLVSQGWLSVTKATDNDEALYDWGPRAKLFVDRQVAGRSMRRYAKKQL